MNKPNFFEENDNIKEISVSFILPNSTLAFNVYDDKGELVFPGHTRYTKEMLNDLKERGLTKLYYTQEEHGTDDNKSAVDKFIENYDYKGPKAISFNTQKKAIGLVDKLVNAFKNLIIDMNSESIFGLVDAINHDLNNSEEEEVINLLDMAEFEDYIYSHSLNVGVISMVFAKKLRLPEDLIREIGIGGFLHDIGTIDIPKSIINKREDLTAHEWTILQDHPLTGYEKVKNNCTISDVTKEIILKHHERVDGSGYPNGLKKDEIPNYVEIVALADIFDALTSDRPYRKGTTTSEALKYIQDIGNLYTLDLIKKFIKEMVILFREKDFYAEGTYVLLNTNELAKIISIDKKMLLRPTIQIISNNQGKRLNKAINIDLKIDFSREIIRKMK